MNPMTDYFDMNKNLEAFTKMYPDFTNAAPLKAATDFAAKYREVTVAALNSHVELTTAWMRDAAKDATTLMTAETQPDQYVKKAGEVATAAFQDLPSRLFAYAEVAKKAQFDLMDTMMSAAPKVAEEAAERTKSVVEKTKTAAKRAA
ncbi:hypothetical protein GC169_07240 [bacterium]|nr:hypothetical protein [bacterium]